MNKERLEKICREAGLVPVGRESMGPYDLFLADGFSHPPHFRLQHKFGVQPDQYPNGVHATLWWMGDDSTLGGGSIVYNERGTLPERLDSAREHARKYIKGRSLRKKNV